MPCLRSDHDFFSVLPSSTKYFFVLRSRPSPETLRDKAPSSQQYQLAQHHKHHNLRRRTTYDGFGLDLVLNCRLALRTIGIPRAWSGRRWSVLSSGLAKSTRLEPDRQERRKMRGVGADLQTCSHSPSHKTDFGPCRVLTMLCNNHRALHTTDTPFWDEIIVFSCVFSKSGPRAQARAEQQWKPSWLC